MPYRELDASFHLGKIHNKNAQNIVRYFLQGHIQNLFAFSNNISCSRSCFLIDFLFKIGFWSYVSQSSMSMQPSSRDY